MVSFISDRVRAILLCGAAALSLPGCIQERHLDGDGSPPDYSIPKLSKSQGKWRFGVTDTIAILFNEKIDTSALDLTFLPPDSIGYRFDGADRLLIFGRRQDAGTRHFLVNTPFSLEMEGLRDLNGNAMGRTDEEFKPYWWADRDFLDSTYQGFDSLFVNDSTWADSSRLFSDTLVAEGRLDFNGNGNREDRQDFLLVKLTPPDSFKFSLTCPRNLNLRMQVAGPFRSGSQDSILQNYSFPGGERTFYADTNKTRGTLGFQVFADFTNHYNLLDSSDAPGLYAIRLSIPEDQEGFYRVRAVVIRKKRH
jgi:hypothetical protein